MPTFTFDAPEHHKLILDASKPDKVIYGGEQFAVSQQQALSLLADKSIPLREETQELGKLPRTKLDDLASGLGLDPESFPSKEKLIEAIEQGPLDHTPSPKEDE